MKLCRHAGAAIHKIWAPRYHDQRVLINAYDVKEHNLITFTKAKIEGWHYLSGATIRKYPKQSNGSIPCFAVPMGELQNFEALKHCEHEL